MENSLAIKDIHISAKRRKPREYQAVQLYVRAAIFQMI